MMEKLKELAMNPAHEILFREKTAKTTSKYFWAANIFVLLFQIYNILYTLFYTDFQLKSQASRVYMVLYGAMLLICILTAVCGWILTAGRKGKSAKLLHLYTAFGCLLLIWSACITLYDQRVSSNISVYMTTAVYIAGLLYIRPRISVPVFIFCEAILLVGILQLDLAPSRDIYGFCVNSVGLTLVALFISLYRWASLRKDFLNHLEMEEKNEMITRQSERLNYLANHDPLTGLWNRNYLSEWTDRFFSENSRRQIAVFVIDIDHFKEYNDTFGHVEGDECLKKVAGVLQELEGIHFRYGGEEFLCLLEITDETQAKHLADRLCSQIEQQKIPSSKPGRYLTVSAGYAVGTMKNDLEFRRLLHGADDALYWAKNNGRNQTARCAPR